ncbi:MAG TPA: hypothetical protein DIC64_04380 [Alphaproteobacteria bacterium]|nr:hypothetical protein [Alphaproteobacteria bacterium]
MKKIVILLTCAVSLLASCKPNTELQKYYASEASRLYKETSEVELFDSQWDYLDAMKNVIAYEVSMVLSPKIGKDLADWEIERYSHWTERLKIEERYDKRPELGSQGYENMLRLQKMYAYQGMADVLKLYQNRSNKSIGMEYQEMCDQVIHEVLQKYPIFFT